MSFRNLFFLLLSVFIGTQHPAWAADFTESVVTANKIGAPMFIQLPGCQCVQAPCNCPKIPNPAYKPASAPPAVSCLLATGASQNPTASNTNDVISHFGRTTCNYAVPNTDPPVLVGDQTVVIGLAAGASLRRCTGGQTGAACPVVSTATPRNDTNDINPRDRWLVVGGNYRRNLTQPATLVAEQTVQLDLPQGWQWEQYPAECSPLKPVIDPQTDTQISSGNSLRCKQASVPFTVSNSGCPRRSADNNSGTTAPDGTCSY